MALGFSNPQSPVSEELEVKWALLDGFHSHFNTKADMLEIPGSTDSPAGPKCRCGGFILSDLTCARSGNYAGVCREKIYDRSK